MHKYRLTIAYDGTHYGGWQVQPNATSIQTLIQNALATILRSPVVLIGSGRTDAGVHALGQVAHFSFENPLSLHKLFASLNALLPPDIRITSIEDAPLDFHARYSAIGKEYHYHLHLERSSCPFKRLYSTPVCHPLDLSLLKDASQLFVGTQDFTSFANEAREGSASRNAVRTLYRIDVREETGGIRLEMQADGFLYKMVRNITGTLLDIGRGKIKLEDIPAIFAAKDRKRAGKTAPAQGLFLVKVHYL